MDIERKIDDLKTRVRENLAERDEVYRALGELFLDRSPEGEPPAWEEHRKAAEAHARELPRLQEVREEIRRCEEELDALKEAEGALKTRKSETGSALDQLRESLGEELYHQLNTMESPDWKGAYKGADEQIAKIRNAESELYQLENQVSKKNLFNSVVGKSRISLLKSKKKGLEASLAKAYRHGFEEALALGAGQGEESPERGLLLPWFRAEEGWREVLQEEADLGQKQKADRDRLKELCGGKAPKKRKEGLEKEIRQAEDSLKDALIKTGESLCGDPPEELGSRPEAAAAAARIDTLTEEGVALNLEIEKWEAKREIGRLEHDKAYMIEKIATLEEEIQARRQEVKVLKKEIAKVGADIEKKEAFTADLPRE